MPQLSTSLIFALIAFAGIFLLFFGVSRMRRSAGGSEDFEARLAAYGVTTAGATTLPPSSGMRESLNRIFQPAADRMGRGDAKKGKPSVAEQLLRADLKLRTSEFFMIQIGSAVLLLLVAGLRFGFGIGSIVQLFLAAAIGYLIPGRYVKYRITRRLRAFNNQLGDTLTLLSNAIKAGYSFAQAIDTVAKNAVPPIADEFGRAVREMNLGGSPDEALQNITKTSTSSPRRTPSTAQSVATWRRSSTTSRTRFASASGSKARSPRSPLRRERQAPSSRSCRSSWRCSCTS